MPSNIVDYGTAQQPNLEAISKALAGFDGPLENCNVHFKEHGVSFRGKPVLALTPEKPNTARAVLDVLYDKKKVGDFYVILFAPGDGTGKEGDYVLNKFGVLGVTIFDIGTNKTTQVPVPYQPEHIRKWNPETIVPRKKLKENVLTELFLPLASFERKKYHQGIVSLEQLTIRPTKRGSELVKDFDLGESVKLYQSRIQGTESYALNFPGCQQLTCGYYRNGERFGDPHAVYFNPAVAPGRPNLLQVAGFLSVEDKDNPLCKVLDEVGIVPE